MEQLGDTMRKYQFFWGLLGNVEAGRPHLGRYARIEMYRLMQYSFRDILEQRLGADETDRIFYDSGYLAGKEFHRNLISPEKDFNAFIHKMQSVLKDMGVGILRIEEADPDKGQFLLTVAEDLDCSGLPELGTQLCTYDEGFIAGLFESFAGRPFTVKEIDCWCTGDRTCRFSATANTDTAEDE
jgi:predicted hydrocarbon binding protein